MDVMEHPSYGPDLAPCDLSVSGSQEITTGSSVQFRQQSGECSVHFPEWHSRIQIPEDLSQEMDRTNEPLHSGGGSILWKWVPAWTLINVTIHFFVLVLLFFFWQMTGVCQTHVTKRGLTFCNFNIPTSVCALSTDLELPYTLVFVFAWEMALYAHRADSSFGSTLVFKFDLTYFSIYDHFREKEPLCKWPWNVNHMGWNYETT